MGDVPASAYPPVRAGPGHRDVIGAYALAGPLHERGLAAPDAVHSRPLAAGHLHLAGDQSPTRCPVHDPIPPLAPLVRPLITSGAL
jgi:hypothetical protein